MVNLILSVDRMPRLSDKYDQTNIQGVVFGVTFVYLLSRMFFQEYVHFYCEFPVRQICRRSALCRINPIETRG